MTEKFNNYSFWRIKNILERDYHYRLEKVNQGYKANRKRNFVEQYDLINNDTDSTILTNITLNSLRKILTEEKYPLKEEK